MLKSLLSVTPENFAPYGEVIEFPQQNKDRFYIVEQELESPWRIAMFRYSNKEIRRLEHHPTSKESFEPYLGITVLVVAENDTPDQYQGFILDKPVCLKKGIWHEVIALTPEAQVKITENAEVNSEFYDFEKSICVALVEE